MLRNTSVAKKSLVTEIVIQEDSLSEDDVSLVPFTLISMIAWIYSHYKTE